MTTRIRLTNLGPGDVEVSPPDQPTFTLKPGQETEAYVYKGHEISYDIVEKDS